MFSNDEFKETFESILDLHGEESALDSDNFSEETEPFSTKSSPNSSFSTIEIFPADTYDIMDGNNANQDRGSRVNNHEQQPLPNVPVVERVPVRSFFDGGYGISREGGYSSRIPQYTNATTTTTTMVSATGQQQQTLKSVEKRAMFTQGRSHKICIDSTFSRSSDKSPNARGEDRLPDLLFEMSDQFKRCHPSPTERKQKVFRRAYYAYLAA